MDCFLCLQTQKDQSALTNFDEIITVQGGISFTIIDLIYLTTNIKIEITDKTSNICQDCINKGTQAFFFKQMCMNVSQRLKKQLNPETKDIHHAIPTNISQCETKIEEVNVTETHITMPPCKSSENLNDYEEIEISDDEKEEEEYETEDFEMLDIKSDFDPNNLLDENESNETEGEPTLKKSQAIYKLAYEKFQAWRKKHNHELSEEILLDYFIEKATTLKPPSLWAIYSMLKATLKANDNVDIKLYASLTRYLKEKNILYRPKRPPQFTKEQINRFLTQASDHIHLLNKVVAVIAIAGCCKGDELVKLRAPDFEDLKTKYLVTVRNSKEKPIRIFVIPEEYYLHVKKYLDLRPTCMSTNRFFLNYRGERCTRQVVGIHKLNASSRRVAEFLKLPNAKSYNNRSFY